MELKEEQLSVINFNEGNILVSASAGSGKTFAMISRAVRLVCDNKAKIKEILAVTFTDASAYDMKQKLKEALSEKILEGGKDNLIEEIKDLDYADICTLHSFASRLIRQYFFEAGVSPDFSILDESNGEELKRECLEKTFNSLYNKGESWFLDLCDKFSYKRKDEKFKDLILDLYEFCCVEANPSEFADRFIENYNKEGFYLLLNQYQSLLKDYLTKLRERAEVVLNGLNSFSLEKGATFLKGVIADIDLIINAKSVYIVKDFSPYKRDVTFESKLTGEPLDLKAKAVEIRDELKGILERYNKHLEDEKIDLERTLSIKEQVVGLVKTVKAFSENYNEEKIEENVLDFSDLEHLALKVLSNEEIANNVRQKYKYVFADEYQDINGVQEEILKKLSNNNMFMVGDVKQSIYGFRGCRPEIFLEKYNSMIQNGEKTALLNYNFRSAQNVIDMVNTIFSFCMKKEQFGVDCEGTSKLTAGGVYPTEYCGRTQLHFLRKEKKPVAEKEQPRIYDILSELHNSKEEDDEISSLLVKLIEEEIGKEYYDFKEKIIKRVELKDIAILTRNKNNAFVSKIVYGMTRRGINVVSDVAENVCDFAEIKVLISLLKLLDCQKNDIPLAMTMLSAFGGFTEQELAIIVGNAKNPKDNFYLSVHNYMNTESGDLKNKLQDFFKFLDELRFYADFNGAFNTLELAIFKKGYENILLLSEDGENKLRRLNRFLSAAKNNGKNYTIKEFIKRIENSPKAFMLSPNSSEDALKVMTIHSSKGLEFPVVIVCGLERNMNAEEEGEEVLKERNTGIALKYYNSKERTVYETPLRGLFIEKMKATRVKEELRLFYVALTRARYSLHLVFSGTKDERKDYFSGAKRFIDYIPNSMSVLEHTEQELQFFNEEHEKRKILFGKENENLKEQIKEKIEYKYPFVFDTIIPLKTSVTASMEKDYQEDSEIKNHHIYQDEFIGKESGIIAHKILENIDFSKEFDCEINRLQKSGIIFQEEISKVNLEKIKKALSNDIFKNICGKEIFKEKSFLVNIPASIILDTQSQEHILVQGIIDLLVVDKDSAMIIDYKYSTLDCEALRQKYQKQLNLYSFAVQKILGKRVDKKALVNILSGDIVDLTK